MIPMLSEDYYLASEKVSTSGPQHLKRSDPNLRRPLLTCVIGAKGADGSVIIADTRVLRNEYEANNESKINLLWDRAVLAGAGATAILDKLAEKVNTLPAPSNPTFAQIEETIEDIAAKLRERYTPRLGTWDSRFDVIFMGLRDFDKGDPNLRLVTHLGVSEEVKDFAIIGHGSQYAMSIFKLLYSNMLTANELGVLGYFTIASIVAMGLDQSVGVGQLGPEAVVLLTDGAPTWLNPLTDQFKACKDSLNTLRYRLKLVKSVWGSIPQAWENFPRDLY